MSTDDRGSAAGTGTGPIKAPQDMVAGLFLIALALFALWAGSNLNAGTMRSMGPGMLPRAVATMVGGVGVILVIGSMIWHGPPIDPPKLKGPLYIALAIVMFGLTVRGFNLAGLRIPALGLLVSGPLAIMVSGFASHETKWGQLVVFAVVMTAFCIGLFKYALGLPIPLAPWLIGY